MRWPVPCLTMFLGTMTLCLCVVPSARAVDDSAVAPPLSDIGGPVIETSLAGFTLQGRTYLERLVIQDLDIVDDGRRRLVPLLRILNALKVAVAETDGVLTFTPDGSVEVVLNLGADLLTVGGEDHSGDMIVGLSDLTLEPEIYVLDELLPDILAMDMSWDPGRYEYSLSVDREIRIFHRERGGAALLSSAGKSTVDLPSLFPAAGLDRSLAPRLDFLRINMQSSVLTSEGDDEVTGNFTPPRFSFWGHAVGGNLTATVTQKDSAPADGYKIDRAFWHTAYDDVELAVGTSNLGLTELTFPSLSLLGMRVNGNIGADSGARDRDPSMLGQRETFQQTHVIEGTAKLGSEVTLLVNGRTVDVMIVQDTDHAPPGEGIYRFEGFNLFVSRLNIVRIVIEEPDGTVEEIEREVLGTDSLVDAGELSFIGAFGSRRLPAADDVAGEGLFSGARMNYGLSEQLMVSASAAFQRDLYGSDSYRYTSLESFSSLPDESTHLGSRLVWQVTDPLLLTVEGAHSDADRGERVDWAYRANAEMHLGEVRVYPAYFHYGPDFFNGQRVDLCDVEGGSLSMVWRRKSGNQFIFGGSRSRDNLRGDQVRTVRVNDAIASWDLRTLIPRTTLTLGTNFVWLDEDAEPYRYDLVGFDSGLLGNWSMRGRFILGDDVRQIMREELPDGTSTRFDQIRRQATNFDARSAMGSGSMSSRFDLRRRLGAKWHVTAAYRSTRSSERSYLDLMRSATYGESWQWRFTPGYDWEDDSYFLQNRVDYLVGGSYRNRIVFENQLQKDDWTVRLSVMVQLNVGFDNLRPIPLNDDRLNPDVGGVKGRVFLDYNGNGTPDDGEPGVEDVALDTDLGWRINSGKAGQYVIPNSSYKLRAHVSLDADNLPAVYTPTHGTQDAIIRSGHFTEVNLGIGAFGSLDGHVQGRTVDGVLQGVAGLKILLVDGAGKVANYSITDVSGSYYLGEIKPGNYVVRVDETLLPDGFTLASAERAVEIFPRDEYFELNDVDFLGELVEVERAEPSSDELGVEKEEFKIFD